VGKSIQLTVISMPSYAVLQQKLPENFRKKVLQPFADFAVVNVTLLTGLLCANRVKIDMGCDVIYESFTATLNPATLPR
jgi:hypothetical protein